MRKELTIAIIVVLVLTGLTAVAFIPPRGAISVPTDTDDVASRDVSLGGVSPEVKGTTPMSPQPPSLPGGDSSNITPIDPNAPVTPLGTPDDGTVTGHLGDPMPDPKAPGHHAVTVPFPSPNQTAPGANNPGAGNSDLGANPTVSDAGTLNTQSPHDTGAVAAPAGVRYHIVQSGEILGDISLKEYGTTRYWKKIAAANPGVDATSLKIGQKLIIPEMAKTEVKTPVGDAAPDQSPSPAPLLPDGQRSYTVKAGDLYVTIARHELGDARRWKEIQTLNKIAPEDLRPGQVIKLPAKAVADAPGHAAGGSQTSAPVSPVDSTTTYVVQSGDLLSTISQKLYGTSKKWKDIEKANPGIDADDLQVGTKLKLPFPPSQVASDQNHGGQGSASNGALPAGGTQDGQATPSSGPKTYVIKAGDRLAGIARRFYHNAKDVDRILKANPGLDPDFLRVGQKIVLPDVPGHKTTHPTPTHHSSTGAAATPGSLGPSPFSPGHGGGNGQGSPFRLDGAPAPGANGGATDTPPHGTGDGRGGVAPGGTTNGSGTNAGGGNANDGIDALMPRP